MRCPHCNCGHHHVSHTWKLEVSWQGHPRTIIRRRRVCRHCKLPFTTVEHLEAEDQPGAPSQDPPPPGKPGEDGNPFLPS